MLQDTFGQWIDLAKQRAEIVLMDGRPATLVAVRKPSRNAKILLSNRHYLVWIDDIALVRWPGSSEWILLDAWPVVDLGDRPGVQVTPREVAEKSRSWLKVTPNPAVLHPSFQPPTEDAFPDNPTLSARRPAVHPRKLWLVPSTPPPTS